MKRLILLILIALNTLPGSSQSTADLTGRLISAGFENVAVRQSGKDLYLFFENRRYRWEPDALKDIFNTAQSILPDSVQVHLIPLHHQVPIAVFNNVSGEYNFCTDSVRNLLKDLHLRNPSNARIDLILVPGFRVQFGNYNHPVEWQVSLSPMLQTSLWKGMLLSAGIFVPLHSELQQEEQNKIRLGTVAVNQLFRLRKNIFLNLSSGIFSYPNRISSELAYQRYGLNADMRKYFLNSRLCAGGYAGITGQERFSEGVFNYWPLDRTTYGVYGEYRDPLYHLTTKVTAGKFLYGDNAVRLDLSRQFGEVSIGFFALKSDFGYNGGFNFCIPISPRRQFKPAAARIAIAQYFNWEYAASTVNPSAAIYNTGYDLDQKLRFLRSY